MPISFGTPPDGGMAQLKDGMGRVDNSQIGSSIPRSSDGSDSRSIHQPIKVVEFTLDQVIQGGSEEIEQPVSWLYLISDGDSVYESAEVLIDEEGGSGGFSHVNRGESATSIVTALNVLEDFGVSEEGDFELRILRIPSIYMNALWLRSPTGDDQIYPFPPVFDPLVAYEKYTLEQLFNDLKISAESRASFDDRPVDGENLG